MSNITTSCPSSLFMLFFLLSLLACLLSVVVGDYHDGGKTVPLLPNEFQALKFEYCTPNMKEHGTFFPESSSNLAYMNEYLTEKPQNYRFAEDVSVDTMNILRTIDFAQIQAEVVNYTTVGDIRLKQLVRFIPAVSKSGEEPLTKQQKDFFFDFDRNMDLLREALNGELDDLSERSYILNINKKLNTKQYEDLYDVFSVATRRGRRFVRTATKLPNVLKCLEVQVGFNRDVEPLKMDSLKGIFAEIDYVSFTRDDMELVQFIPVIAASDDESLTEQQRNFFDNFDRNIKLMAEAVKGNVIDCPNNEDILNLNKHLKRKQHEELCDVFGPQSPKQCANKQLKGATNIGPNATNIGPNATKRRRRATNSGPKATSSCFSLLRIRSACTTDVSSHLFTLLFSSPSVLAIIGSLVISLLSV
eukprot:GHVS01005770.1.p1 GENE.GHVS01005770.1~~GHVS01005770.1.p1  ORF type:complete len:430 (+),score=28.22 GHVS01005770.1:42-1292(+)